jgi:hypothetical protein
MTAEQDSARRARKARLRWYTDWNIAIEIQNLLRGLVDYRFFRRSETAATAFQ